MNYQPGRPTDLEPIHKDEPRWYTEAGLCGESWAEPWPDPEQYDEPIGPFTAWEAQHFEKYGHVLIDNDRCASWYQPDPNDPDPIGDGFALDGFLGRAYE